MQEPSTLMIPDGTDNATTAKMTAEHEGKVRMMSDKRFKNIFKFLLFMFDGACKNAALFPGKLSFIKVNYFIFDSIFCVSVE